MSLPIAVRCAAVMLFALVWSGLAFCDEIHDAARAGDLEKVKMLLRAIRMAAQCSRKNTGLVALVIWMPVKGTPLVTVLQVPVSRLVVVCSV